MTSANFKLNTCLVKTFEMDEFAFFQGQINNYE